MSRPRIALTMGDVAGIGPELVARVCINPDVRSRCVPIVVGDPEILQRALRLIGVRDAAGIDCVVCLDAATTKALREVQVGAIDAVAGRAAYEWLVIAAKAALDGDVDAIVTAPLNKAALHAGGVPFPGHTEILADVCGVESSAMMLHVPPAIQDIGGRHGLSVAHVTLHTSIASVPAQITESAVRTRIDLLHDFLRRIGGGDPRIGVSALNPHAGEQGLFGDEESRAIRPAVESAKATRMCVEGPIPADALMRQAISGQFDGVVVMYHDQGHIPIKLVARDRAVNVTLGLPIIRTSPSHGTAFDIAWQGLANAEGMKAAIDVALLLVATRNCRSESVRAE